MSTFNWPRELTLKLINLYRDQPVLYKPSHPHYKNSAKRFSAIMEIRRQLLSVYPDYQTDANEIRKKIHGIRTQYLKEKKLKMQTIKYRRTLWCYDRLRFLDNIDKIYKRRKHSESSLNNIIGKSIESRRNEELQTEDAVIKEESNETFSHLSKDEDIQSKLTENKFHLNQENSNEDNQYVTVQDAVSTSSNTINLQVSQNENDEIDCFVRILAAELKKIQSNSKKRKLKKLLFSIILDAQEEEENSS